jgi:tRNA/tmRNA/rRNA uracil-C5-methylase (TrmA/RlmC/RlmD family)
MVRGRPGAPKIGLFAEGSHRVIDIPRCPIHHPRVNEVVRALRLAMRESAARPYADAQHTGLVRAVQVVVERSTQRVQVVLVANDLTPDATEPLASALARRLGSRLHALWWNGNAERTNVILGPHWQRLAGADATRERIGGADVFFPPGAFGQSHLDLADRIVERVYAFVPDGARVAELYAGCGAIGLGLVARAREVVFNEESPQAIGGLGLGIAALPDEARSRVQVMAGKAADHVDALHDADVVIVDPPRKGLDAAVVAALCDRPPARLVYVSCAVTSFERDLVALTTHSPLRLVGLEAFALFPYTDHVELLGVLEVVREKRQNA